MDLFWEYDWILTVALILIAMGLLIFHDNEGGPRPA